MSTTNRSTLGWGLLLIVVGLLFLLNNLQVLPAGLVQWWPALVLLAGVWLLGQAMARRQGGRLVGGVVVVALGAYWLMGSLVGVDDRILVPALMIALGVGLLGRSLARW